MSVIVEERLPHIPWMPLLHACRSFHARPPLQLSAPSDFPNEEVRSAFRQRALRDEIIRMCDKWGRALLEETCGGERTLCLRSIQPLAERGYTLIDYLEECERNLPGGREDYEVWNISKKDLHAAYNSLSVIDLLRYCCPELEAAAVREYARRFPWDPAGLPRFLTDGKEILCTETALRPWYTLQTVLWERYAAECETWVHGALYTIGTCLPHRYVAKRPWLRQEFSVNVTAALTQLAQHLPPHPEEGNPALVHPQVTVTSLLLAGLPANSIPPRCPEAYRVFRTHPFGLPCDLWTSSATWEKTLQEAFAIQARFPISYKENGHPH